MEEFYSFISLSPPFVSVTLLTGMGLLTEQSDAVINTFQLTQEQVDRIKVVDHEYFEQARQFSREIRQSEIGMVNLIVSPALSEQIRQEEHELETLKLRAAKVYFEKFLAIREILTPPQRQSIYNTYLSSPIDGEPL